MKIQRMSAIVCVVLSFGWSGITDCSAGAIVNPGADTGDMTGWTIDENGGNGWTAASSFAHSGSNAFATSWLWDTRHQVIDLVAAGYPVEMLDASPPITVGEWVGGYWGGYFFLNFKLLDANLNPLSGATWEYGTKATPKYIPSPTEYTNISHTFTNYGSGVRYIYFGDGGHDDRYWAGYYGPCFDDAYIAIAARPALELQLYAGLKIAGYVGAVYSLEYITDLAQSNNPSAWHCLDYLKLGMSPFLWIDKSVPATERRFYRATLFPAPTNMVFLPSGTFLMGSPTNEVGHQSNESPQTSVTISRGFWMGRYEVTQGEFLGVMGRNPSFHKGDLQFPVEFVSWTDASNYCALRTQGERAAGQIAPNSFYRLPTEAEWEYACRAGSSTRLSYGEDAGYAQLGNYAWFSANSGNITHPVGQKLPNAWGLYDMHGNVWELCLDTSGYPAPSYPGGSVIDPRWTYSGWGNSLIRGGCATAPGEYSRSARRDLNSVGGAGWMGGFRVVLVPGQP